MAIIGIGNDIIEIHRIQKVYDRYGSRFLDRILTPTEQDYCLKHHDVARHVAGRFAAKEAIAKALGTGLSQGLNWLDIEIVNNSAGKPVVSLSPQCKNRFNDPTILLSISHSKDYATATALAQIKH